MQLIQKVVFDEINIKLSYRIRPDDGVLAN